MADTNFANIKTVIKQIVKKYGQGKVRYSLIVFGDSATIKISFTENYSDNQLKNLIEATPKSSGGPFLDKALAKAKEMFDQNTRRDSRKVLVVFIDKTSASQPNEEKIKLDAITEDKIHSLFVLWGIKSVNTASNLAPSNNILSIDTAVTTPNPSSTAENVMHKVNTGR